SSGRRLQRGSVARAPRIIPAAEASGAHSAPRGRPGAGSTPPLESVKSPPQSGEDLILYAHIRLGDGRDLEPPVAGETREALREAHFSACGEVVQVVSRAEGQHAGRVEGTAEGRDSPPRNEGV